MEKQSWMESDYKSSLVDAIIAQEDKSGCWNVLTSDDPHFAHRKLRTRLASRLSVFWAGLLLERRCSTKRR